MRRIEGMGKLEAAWWYAVQRIDKSWGQGRQYDGQGHTLCLLGALNSAAEECRAGWTIYRQIIRAVEQEIMGRPMRRPMRARARAIADWNDVPGREYDEVVEVIRGAKRWL